MTASIYVVDDEAALTDSMVEALQPEFTALGFYTAENALQTVRDDPPDLVLLDIGLPGMSGIEALAEFKKLWPDMPVIMITAYEDTQTIVRAMKNGAYDYVVKPVDMDMLEVTIHNAMQSVRLRREFQELQDACLKENMPVIAGRSKAFQEVIETVTRIARSPDTPVLIEGESGTGKELLSKAIHFRSPLFKGPLVALNCAALPKDLVESELFGYEPGAFSGASTQGKKGVVEEADGGTLFLDEIGDLGLEAQAKLLRFLDSGEFSRLGSPKCRRVKIRIVAATNKNLMNEMARGNFRQDLYYRIGVVKITVPSLSQRPCDIVPIALHFLCALSDKLGRHFTGLTKEAEKKLQQHDWPGNIRELKNIIERAVLMAEGPEVTAGDLFLEVRDMPQEAAFGREAVPEILPAAGVDLDGILINLQKKYMETALRQTGGNEAGAAALLGIKYTTFRYHRKKYNLP